MEISDNMTRTRRMQSTGAILVNPRGQILLQQRDDKPGLLFAGYWTTLGGAIEAGETPDQAIRRELLEEIELEPAVKLWKVYDHSHTLRGVWVTVEQYLYVGRIEQEISEITLNEGQALGFFDVDDLAKLPIAFDFAPLFREFFAVMETLL